MRTLSPRCLQPPGEVETGKLCPLITVEDLWVSHPQRLLQRLQAEPDIPRNQHRPREDIPTEPIPPRHQGNKALTKPNVCTICTPDVMHPYDRYPAQQVGGHSVRRMRLTRARSRIDRLQAQGPEQPHHPLGIHLVALAASPGSHPPHAVIWRLRVLPIQEPHPLQILRALPLGALVVS
jgi:hypothetical protein